MLNWTVVPPQEEGMYFCKRQGRDKGESCHVERQGFTGPLMVTFHGEEECEVVSLVGALWYGPLRCE